MESFQDCYNKIYETLNGYYESAASIQTEIEERLKKRSEEIPARIENLQIRLKKIDEYECRILDLVRLAKMHITSLNLPTIEVPFGYRINLSRLEYWSKLIDPMSEDDVYAQRIYLVGSCDLEFLSVKREEYRAKIVQLDDDYNQSAPEEIKKLEDSYLEVINIKNVFLSSPEFLDFTSRVIDINAKAIDSSEGDSLDVISFPLGSTEEDKRYIKSHLGVFYDEELGVISMPADWEDTSDEIYGVPITDSAIRENEFSGESVEEFVRESEQDSNDEDETEESFADSPDTENDTDEITEFIKEE